MSPFTQRTMKSKFMSSISIGVTLYIYPNPLTPEKRSLPIIDLDELVGFLSRIFQGGIQIKPRTLAVYPVASHTRGFKHILGTGTSELLCATCTAAESKCGVDAAIV